MAKAVEKNVHVLEYELPLKVEALEECGFLATSQALQGVLAEGDTISEAVANAMDVASSIIEIRKEKGLKVPLKLLKRKSAKVYRTTVTVQSSV